MRTETIQIFTFNELSDEAKEKAINDYSSGDCVFGWHSEWADSLKEFEDAFHIKTDWEVSLWGNSYIRIEDLNHPWFRFSDTIESEEMSGLRLWKYIKNNNLFSNINGNCCFTGYCADINLVKPFLDFMQKPRDITYKELIQECLDSWLSAYLSDLEYSYSKEAITETLVDCEYEFLKDGSIH